MNNKELAKEDSDHNYHKKIIVTKVRENIDLIFTKFASIKKVEHLEEHKNIKENAEMLSILTIPVFLL